MQAHVDDSSYIGEYELDFTFTPTLYPELIAVEEFSMVVSIMPCIDGVIVTWSEYGLVVEVG